MFLVQVIHLLYHQWWVLYIWLPVKTMSSNYVDSQICISFCRLSLQSLITFERHGAMSINNVRKTRGHVDIDGQTYGNKFTVITIIDSLYVLLFSLHIVVYFLFIKSCFSRLTYAQKLINACVGRWNFKSFVIRVKVMWKISIWKK